MRKRRQRGQITGMEARRESRFIIVMALIIAGIIAMALWGYLSGSWEAQGQEPSPPRSKYEDQILRLEREALDEAFRKHMVRLYDIWVTDYNPSMPPRAVKGARNARDAYERYLAAIEQREQKLQQ